MTKGILSVSRNLYYIPILLGIFYYEKKGLYLAIMASSLYAVSAIVFDRSDDSWISAFLIMGIFISIANLVYLLILRYKKQEIVLEELILHLKENDIRMKTAEGLALIGNWDVDLVTEKVIWSDGIFRILGLEPGKAEPSFELMKSCIHEEDRELVIRLIMESLRNYNDYEIEARIMHMDGELRYINIKGIFIEKNGLKQKHISMIRDITVYKQFDKIQSKNIERYKSIYNISEYPITSEKELFEIVLNKAISLTDSKRGYIFLLDEEKQEMTPVVCSDPDLYPELTSKYLISQILTTRQPIIENDLSNSEIIFPDGANNVSAQRLIATPIFDGTIAVATVVVLDKPLNYDQSDKNQLIGFLKGCWEIIKRKRAETALQEQGQWLKTTLLSIADGVIATDVKGMIIMVNRESERITGYTKEEAIGNYIWDVYQVYSSEKDQEHLITMQEIIEKKNLVLEGKDTYFITKDKEKKDLEIKQATIAIPGNAHLGYVIAFRDVTEKKRNEKKIFSLTYQDKLTGLYNRRYLEERLQEFDAEEYLPISVIVGDVNGLKLTNDAFGHLAGDTLLIAAGKVMKEVSKINDVIARWGGDECMILLPNTTSEEVKERMNLMHIRCLEVFVNNINLSIALGYATKMKLSESIMSIFKKADDMMYKNKLLESNNIKNNAVISILASLHEKSVPEEEHSIRVSKFCKQIGEV